MFWAGTRLDFAGEVMKWSLTGQSKALFSGAIGDTTVSSIDPLPVGSTGRPEIFSKTVIQFAASTVLN